MLLPGGTHDHLALDDVGSEDVNSDGDSENYEAIAESKLASLVALYFCLQLLITTTHASVMVKVVRIIVITG